MGKLEATLIEETDKMIGKALVLGASGAFGSEMARTLAQAGWQVTRYQRGCNMTRAATGMDVIVNGLNPPNYHNWKQHIPQITDQVLAAARASGATVLVPGNVYVYGEQPGPWGADTPHRPVSVKGEYVRRITISGTWALGGRYPSPSGFGQGSYPGRDGGAVSGGDQ